MASHRFFIKRISKDFAHNMIGSFNEPASLEAYRKMIYFRFQRLIITRCNNLGMKELDISLGKWAAKNA